MKMVFRLAIPSSSSKISPAVLSVLMFCFLGLLFRGSVSRLASNKLRADLYHTITGFAIKDQSRAGRDWARFGRLQIMVPS